MSAASPASGGYGPGGGGYPASWTQGAAGSYATVGAGLLAGATYGNPQVVPLLGGSGGAGASDLDNGGAGAGGGAILIAAGGTITVNGQVRANGGNGTNMTSGGSGGAVRLVASTVQGSGSLRALEGSARAPGGAGRIRVEANSVTLASMSPTPSLALPDVPPLIWPPADAPRLRAVSFDIIDVNGVPRQIAVPEDPGAALSYPLADALLETIQPVTLHIEANYVPLDWIVKVRVTAVSGDTASITAAALTGDLQSSTTTATFSLPNGFSAIQLRADAP